jgi:hypothetical protein
VQGQRWHQGAGINDMEIGCGDHAAHWAFRPIDQPIHSRSKQEARDGDPNRRHKYGMGPDEP